MKPTHWEIEIQSVGQETLKGQSFYEYELSSLSPDETMVLLS
jgi:hypothetical protein